MLPLRASIATLASVPSGSQFAKSFDVGGTDSLCRILVASVGTSRPNAIRSLFLEFCSYFFRKMLPEVKRLPGDGGGIEKSYDIKFYTEMLLQGIDQHRSSEGVTTQFKEVVVNTNSFDF